VLPELDVLLRVAMSLTRNAADAEDLVQDTLLRAYGAVERFDGRYPRAWLLTIMRNAQVNRVRRRRPELLRDPEAGDRILESQDPHDSAEQDALRDAFDARVEEALQALPDKFKRVVRLVDLDGLSSSGRRRTGRGQRSRRNSLATASAARSWRRSCSQRSSAASANPSSRARRSAWRCVPGSARSAWSQASRTPRLASTPASASR
jgi:RNA polymerase sigma factor (sigma-70 family)